MADILTHKSRFTFKEYYKINKQICECVEKGMKLDVVGNLFDPPLIKQRISKIHKIFERRYIKGSDQK